MNLVDNGLHSFKKVIKSLSELDTYRNTDEYEFEIKEIIISLHHSIETLFKYIIKSESECLIYDKIEDFFLYN
ncbi:hypothetical protein QJS64_04975 [Paraclostridium bifermentans]|uniref:Uncharacterized protein n=1 Tax=Paraclostridium bifermentans TaxID=1490 RepID=A0ABY8R734_PARBF|nr:hypothetical protein QJS64_04975 [Paraclostridium bifermentans]